MSKHLPWFRFHVRTIESPKVQLLPDSLFKAWVNLLCVARMGNGVLPPVRDIAFRLRISEKDVSKQLSSLIAAELIEKKDCGLMPHDWDEMQYESDASAERTRRYRERLVTSQGSHDDSHRDGSPLSLISESASVTKDSVPRIEVRRGILGAHKLRSVGDAA